MQNNNDFTFFLNDVKADKLKQLKHDARYIYWAHDATKELVDWNDWNLLISNYKDGHEVPEVKGCKTVRALWAKDKSYRIDDKSTKNSISLYTSDIVEGKQILKIYYTYLDAEKAARVLPKGEKGAGSAGFNYLNKVFKEHTGLTLTEAFGSIQNHKGTTGFDKCVNRVKYAIYLDKRIQRKITPRMYKADISSAWPQEISYDLPDLNRYKLIQGYAPPTEDFPIAYYLKSGHIAEYGKYDTHTWQKDKWYSLIEQQSKENFKPRNNHEKWETFETIADNEEITVLCPLSEWSIKPAIDYMYQQKEDKSDLERSAWFKAMLNSMIGFMRSNDYNRGNYMGHIAAIAYARATNRMMNMARELEKEGNFPIYFAIDSIIWIGKETKLTSDKKLGAFVLEAADGRGVIANHGQYYIEKDGEKLIERHQGIPDNIYETLEIKNITDFCSHLCKGVIDAAGYDKETHHFIMKRRINI